MIPARWRPTPACLDEDRNAARPSEYINAKSTGFQRARRAAKSHDAIVKRQNPLACQLTFLRPAGAAIRVDMWLVNACARFRRQILPADRPPTSTSTGISRAWFPSIDEFERSSNPCRGRAKTETVSLRRRAASPQANRLSIRDSIRTVQRQCSCRYARTHANACNGPEGMPSSARISSPDARCIRPHAGADDFARGAVQMYQALALYAVRTVCTTRRVDRSSPLK